MSRHRILIADGNATTRQLMAEALVTEGYAAITAANAQEAIECMTHFHPDLVLVDIQAPALNAHELIERVQREFGPLPVIAMTNNSETAATRARFAGAGDYVSKPVELDALFQHIERALAVGV
jgi:CheY-like chemotaxis protein